jgi:hypothetical protein
MDAYQEELGRWIDRAHKKLAGLPAGSADERLQAEAIRRMEHQRLGHSIRVAHAQLIRLPIRSEERRRLAEAIEQMDDEYARGLRVLHLDKARVRSRTLSTPVGAGVDLKGALIEARRALQLASQYLRHPTADAGRAEVIAQVEHALARLNE